MRKGTSGIKTALLFLILAILLVWGLYRLTETNIFEIDKEYVAELAGKASITDFKKSCKIYGLDYLEANQDETKGKPIYYKGKIIDIKTSAFGDSQVLLNVVGDKYKLEEDTLVIVKVTDEKYLRANKGDKVEVFGKFNSVTDNKGTKTINVDGVRVTLTE